MPSANYSLNSWPAPPPKLKTFQVPGANRRLTCDADAGRILVALAADYHATVRAIDVGQVDDGGYNYRPAAGNTRRLSNHASGTAIDLNWREEGAQGSALGAKFFAAAKNRLAVEALKRRYGRWVQWGGDWRAKDYMHWEIKPGVTRAQVLAACDTLNIDIEGRRAK